MAFVFVTNCADFYDKTKDLAEQGNVDAQYNLGLMYYKGEGVLQDYKEAEKWFRMAAKQGDPIAQSELASMYAKGEGVPQDYSEAEKWFLKAAEQGNAIAQHNLGVMYYNGQGGQSDYLKAYAWINVAAANGSKNAPKSRSTVERLMTAGQIAEAQNLSREWFEKYQPKE